MRAHPIVATPGCAQSRLRRLLGAMLLAAALVAGVLAARPAGARGPYPTLGSCSVFPQPPASLSPRTPSLPTEAAWNQGISQASRDPRSCAYIAHITAHGVPPLHPDCAAPRPDDPPYSVPRASQRKLPIH